jgi:hypothetical protein
MFFFVRSSCILSFYVLCDLLLDRFIPSPSVLASQTCLEENEEWTFIIVYAPNEDDTEENKTHFYDWLQRIFETTDRKVFLLGDMNARVENNPERWNGVIGEQGEETLNNNGGRLLNFCIMNDLIILNKNNNRKNIF